MAIAQEVGFTLHLLNHRQDCSQRYLTEKQFNKGSMKKRTSLLTITASQKTQATMIKLMSMKTDHWIQVQNQSGK